MSVWSENSVGRAWLWKWGEEGAYEACRKAICSFAGGEGIGPLDQLTQPLLVGKGPFWASPQPMGRVLQHQARC